MNEQNTFQSNEPTQSSKYFWITVTAVVFTAIIVGGGVYVWQKSGLHAKEQFLQQQIADLRNQVIDLQKTTQSNLTDPEAVEEPVQLVDETENWETYNYKNLSFKYPEDWVVVFDSEVHGQPNGFSLHVMRKGDGGLQPDLLGLSTYNDRASIPDYYPLNNDRVLPQTERGDSYIKFVTNDTTIYAGCGYYLKGEATLEVCNKIIKTVTIE